MWDTSTVMFSASGTFSFMDAIADGSAGWPVTATTSFDRQLGEGIFLAGSSITIGQAASVPAPGPLLLVGMGNADLGFAHRRTA